MNHIAVIKIGTSLLTNSDGSLKISFLGRITEEISAVQKNGWGIVLVSSGAMASGTGILKGKPHDIVERSLFACVGQPFLMKYYADFFGIFGIIVAQTLLTRRDFENEEASVLLEKNMSQMIKNGIIPIANENDLISIEELTVGDNDQLSARIAVLLNAEKLIIVSDVDGLYSENPQTNPHAQKFEVVECITENIEACVGEKISKNSLGGMKSKLSAAKYATQNGVETVIFSGIEDRNALSQILREEKNIGTRFLSQQKNS